MKQELSQNGFDLIKHYEGLHDGDLTQIGLQPKMCPANIWTIGWGHAIFYKGRFLKGLSDKELAYKLFPNLTLEEADKWLAEDVKERVDAVNNLQLELTQGQFDALVDFVYNEGIGNLNTSTLLQRIRLKASPMMIEEAFSRFKYGGGKVLPGLILRRRSESELFNNGDLKFYTSL
jgi:lysozyme